MLAGAPELEPLARFGPSITAESQAESDQGKCIDKENGGETETEESHSVASTSASSSSLLKGFAIDEAPLANENITEDGEDEETSLLSILRGPKLQDLTRLHPDQNLNEMVVFRPHDATSAQQTQQELKDIQEQLHFAAGELLGPFQRESGSLREESEIDVVASDEDIKKVFQLSLDPVGTTCSLVVQRVGNALVLDGSFGGAGLTVDDPSGASRGQLDALTSKFLFYSVKRAESPQDEQNGQQGGSATKLSSKKKKKRTRAAVAVARETSTPVKVDEFEHSLSDVNDEVASTTSTRSSSEDDHSLLGNAQCDVPFARVVRWRVGDFNLLLGSNLVIARDQENSCDVTLQLHDATDKVTSQVCLDFWLDNKINGAQRTAICIHKEGLVQGYKLVDTEALPSLVLEEGLPGACQSSEPGEGLFETGFVPTAVASGACSILSFLKENCSEDGATYYLFKRPGDSSEVCLFELMSPEASSKASTGLRRRFAAPVANLYQRLASRLLGEGTEANRGRAIRLLKQSIQILDLAGKADFTCLAASVVSKRLLATAYSQTSSMRLPLPTHVYLQPSTDNDGQFMQVPQECLASAMKYLLSALHDVHALAAAARRQRGASASEGQTIIEEDEDQSQSLFQVEGDSLTLTEFKIREEMTATLLRLGLANLETPVAAAKYALLACRIADPTSVERHMDVLLFWVSFLFVRASLGSGHVAEAQEQPSTSADEAKYFEEVMRDVIHPIPQALAVLPGLVYLIASGNVDMELALNQVTQLLWRSVSKRPRRDCSKDLLFEVYLALAKYYAAHGRFTKAFRHLQQGVQMFRSLQSIDRVETLQLELLCLSWESFCGIDLREAADLISAETLLSVVSDAEAQARAQDRYDKFGLQINRQALCSHDLEAYRRAWAAAQNLIDSASASNLTLSPKATIYCAIAAARYGVEAFKQNSQDEGKKALLLAIQLAETHDVYLTARCRLAYALGTAQRLNKGPAGAPKAIALDNASERVLKAVVSEFQTSLECFETFASQIDASPEVHEKAVVDALVTRCELARLHLFIFESNNHMFRLCRAALDYLLDCAPLLEQLADQTAKAEEQEKDGEDYHWAVIKKLLQRTCQQGLRMRKDDASLKQAYRRSLETDEPAKMLSELTEILRPC